MWDHFTKVALREISNLPPVIKNGSVEISLLLDRWCLSIPKIEQAKKSRYMMNQNHVWCSVNATGNNSKSGVKSMGNWSFAVYLKIWACKMKIFSCTVYKITTIWSSPPFPPPPPHHHLLGILLLLTAFLISILASDSIRSSDTRPEALER